MERIKFARDVFFQASYPKNFEVTIFLGIYNGASYLESLKSQLLSQTLQNFHLLVVDNQSSDDSLNMLASWATYFPGRITVARNQINLGGSGNLLNSFDLIETPWFTAIHQDDSYGPNHVQVLVDGIRKSTNDVVAISTVMGSMDNQGKIIGTVPRASMFAKSNDPPSAFLQNLRIHSVPWPASAFRTEVFGKTFAPWHSTAFPDTEQILRMCAYGIFVTIDQETMHYRENPNSESHIVNSGESQTGAALSLCRVLNSNEFSIILLNVKKEELERFAKGLLDAIDSRFEGTPLGGFLSLVAIERLIEITGYGEPSLLTFASSIYENFGSNYSFSLLTRLASLSDTPQSLASAKTPSLDSFIKGLENSLNNESQNESIFSRFVRTRFFQGAPYRAKKYLFTGLVYIFQRFKKFNHFKFDWK